MIKQHLPILILLLLIAITCSCIAFAAPISTTEEVTVIQEQDQLRANFPFYSEIKEKTEKGESNTPLIAAAPKKEIISIEVQNAEVETSEKVEVVEVFIQDTETVIPKQEIIVTPTSTNIYNFTEEEIDMITNVVMHEVGGIYGSGSSITITYANGYNETYQDACLIHKIHTQVLINQYMSSLFPNSLSKCICLYWASYLANTNYYNKNNETWQHCRADVVDVITNGGNLPNNIFGATCDPYFTSYYPMYSKYATVQWNTTWLSGFFYYYQYNG